VQSLYDDINCLWMQIVVGSVQERIGRKHCRVNIFFDRYESRDKLEKNQSPYEELGS